MADTPQLLYFDLQERNKGLALLRKMCLAVNCSKPSAYLTIAGLVLSGKHVKDDAHDGLLTPKDLRLLADFIEAWQAEKCATMADNDERRDAA